MFSVELSSSAKKIIEKSDHQLAKRLVEKIEQLATDPFPSGVKRVVNQQDVTDINKRERAYQ